MKRLLAFALIAVLAGTGGLISGGIARADSSVVVDFEGLAEGLTISVLSVGSGISGDPVAGSIAVNGINPELGTLNAAMIFNSHCPHNCSGLDYDLGSPNETFGGPGRGIAGEAGSPFENDIALGNVAIVTEDNNSFDPDDASVIGAVLEFDYSGFGPGNVTVNSLNVIDVEQVEPGAHIDLYAGAVLVATVAIGPTGDNGLASIPIGVAGVDRMRIVLNGSGAIDNIELTIVEERGGGEGCTPGYWKQSHHFDSWEVFSPSDDYEATFGVDASFSKTLLGALEQGGGGEKALGRHATAALLNAASGGVDYAFTTAEVIAIVQAAYASGDFEGAKNQLESENEMGCGLN